MKYIWAFGLTLILLGMGLLIYAWSGFYNIAATEPHWGFTQSLVETLRDRSIAARSQDVRVSNLDDPNFRKAAFSHYHEMCRLSHGAPGYPPVEFARGLYPSPPEITSGQIQENRSDAEIYWIIRHGFKMTGMPAFGPTHEEKELWSLVALAKEIPRMAPEKYRGSVTRQGEESHPHAEAKEEENGGHDHGGISSHE